MPRSSTSSRPSSSYTFPKTPVQKALPLPPPRVAPSAPLPPVPYYQPPGFLQSVKDGFSFGVGTSVARNLVDGWFGSGPKPTGAFAPTTPTVSPPPSNTKPRCLEEQTSFDLCVKAAPHDIQTCQKQLDDLNTCLKF